MIDFEKAQLDPSLVFTTPDELIRRNDLSREQKIEILRHWDYDIRELQVADEENRRGKGPRVTLDAVRRALRDLDALGKTERSAPTKQGGL